MKAWLKDNKPVDGEDLERHDKWLCMMWPRLHLLKELLSDDGVIFVSIDDNEQHHLRMLMDEVFGEHNFLAKIAWQGMDTIKNDARFFSTNSENVLVFARDIDKAEILGFPKTEKQRKTYKNYDNDPRGDYLLTPLHAKSGTEASLYEYVFPNGQNWKPPRGAYPRYSVASLQKLVVERRIYLDPQGKRTPQRKTYWHETSSRMRPHTFWPYEAFGSTRQANAELRGILGRGEFENPKPSRFVRACVDLVTSEDSIVLDSFAGSGTTAHAVLALNKEYGGNRKFILVECEDYADTITAERVRRVINGVPGAHDDALQNGLGGSFTYCTLGGPIDLEAMLTGGTLPAYSALAAYLLHTATGVSAGSTALDRQNTDGLFYSNDATDYYLLYEPDVDWLRGNDGMLNEERTQRIHAIGRKAVVFGPGKFMGQRELTAMDITFCQLPYEMYRTGQ